MATLMYIDAASISLVVQYLVVLAIVVLVSPMITLGGHR